ncbi:MAG: carboxypeptidase regulatory-like domain-containing protein [Gemmatimonadetes bacterium]|nr:carboxypeptidase regulatory-like domain-containing protein [Gemmatimonadota bacterium]
MSRTSGTLLVLALVALPAHAQVVSGRVIRDSDRTPIAGAVITLVHDNERIRPILSDADGRFTYHNAPTGNWIVRADAAGYGMSYSEAFRLGPRDSIDVSVRLTPFAQQLAAVRIEPSAKCTSDPASDARVGVLWSAVHSTLEANMATERERQTPLEITVVDNVLDAAFARQKTTPFKTARAWSGVGFRAYPPAMLSEIGYARVFRDSLAAVSAELGVSRERVAAQSAGGLGNMLMTERELEEREYYLPDADVLMSPSFLHDHCFRAVERAATAAAPRAVGIAFTPTKTRLVTEVQGTLWIDPVSAELRQLEVEFLIPNRDRALPNARAILDFLQLPTGRWIVGHWALRMPIERSQRNSMDNGFETKVGGWSEREGTARVLPLKEASSIAPGAVVRGQVLDGTTGRPLTDAALTLDDVGTELTDSTGHFTFRIYNPLMVPQPTKLTMRSERVAVLGVLVPPRPVKFQPGDTIEVNIGIPSAQRMREALCGGVVDSIASTTKGVAIPDGTVVGKVTTSADGIEGALVTANWYIDNQGKPSATPTATMARRLTRSLEGGRYVVCALPLGVPLTVHAEFKEQKGTPVAVTATATALAEAFLTVPPALPPPRPPRKP